MPKVKAKYFKTKYRSAGILLNVNTMIYLKKTAVKIKK
jgi:hypothetical protein